MKGLLTILLPLVLTALAPVSLYAEEPIRSRFNVRHPTLVGASEPVQRGLELSRERWAQELQRATSQEEQAVALGHLGEVYLAHGFDQAASDAFAYAIETAPNNARWYYFYGVSQENSFQVDEALVAYKKAISLADDASIGLPEMRERLASLLLSMGQAEAARSELEKLSEASIPTAFTHVLHARIAYATGDYESAKERLVKAQELQEGDSLMIALAHVQQLNKPSIATKTRGLPEAERKVAWSAPRNAPWLDGLSKLARGVSHYLEMGQDHLDQGRYLQARSVFKTAVEIGPSRPDAHMAYARINEILGDLPIALDHYQRVLELNPEFAIGWYFLGAFFEREQDDQKAREYYSRALEHNADYVAPRWQLAHSLMRARQFDLAEVQYQEITRLQPKRSAAWYYLGLAGLAQTDCDRSLLALETAYDLNRHDSLIQEALVRATALCSQDPDRLNNARSMALRIEKARPDVAAAVTLAMAYAALQEFDDAVKTQNQAVRRDSEKSMQLQDQLAQYQSKEPVHMAWPQEHPIFAPAPLTPH